MYSSEQKKLVLFLSLLLCACITNAQSGYRSSITTSVNRTVFALGEQIELTLTYSHPIAETPKTLPYINDSFPHFEVIERKKADTTLNADLRTIRQVVLITSFDTGHWSIPPFALVSGKNNIASDSIGIDVTPVPLSGNSYNDIKEIIEVAPEPFDWKKWLAIIFSVALVAVGVWYYIKNRNKPKPEAPRFDSKLSPLEQALQELTKLKQSGLAEKGEMKSYYSKMSDILKIFLERQVAAGFMQHTTDETLIALKDKFLDAESTASLAEALRVGDAVKFAKYSSSVQESSRMTDVIENTVKKIPQKA